MKGLKEKKAGMAKKMKGSGEYSKVSFTPRNEKEKKSFEKRFRSKTG